MEAELGIDLATDALPGSADQVASRRRWHIVRGPVWLAGLVPFVLVGAVRAGWFSEGDTFWEIQAGVEVLQRHTMFLRDDFSWTVAGRPWHPNAWLFDVLLGVAYDVAGPLGLALFTVALLALLGVAVGAAAQALSARTLPLATTATLAALPMLAWLSTRPQTVTYALLLFALLLAGRSLQYRGWRRVLALTGLYLLIALWINLHLAALGILPAVAAGLAAQLVLRPRRTWPRELLASGAVLSATVLGCLSSPLGTSVITSALATRDASSRQIIEWAPLWRTSTIAVVTWLGAAVAVGLGYAAWRRRPRDPLLAMFTAGAAALLLLGVEAARFSPMALTAAIPAVAAWGGERDWVIGRLRPRIAFLATRTAAAWLAAMLVITLVRLPDLGQPTPASYPTAATVDAIPAGCRTLNEYDDGGYIILRRHTAGVTVALDGRNDVYGATLIAHLQGIIAGRPGSLRELQQEGVGCLLLQPDRPLVTQAVAAGWQLAARDRKRVLLVAPAAPGDRSP